MYIVLYRIFGYRKKVIYKNLSQSFPELNKKDLNKLMSRAFKNLADILVEGIKGFTMTHGQIKRRHKILNPEIVEPFHKDGKSIIALPTHYGNWEWGALSPGLYFKDYNIVAFYKPLTNKYVDRFIRKNRARTGSHTGFHL